MEKPLISVIIPVYNVEKYIHKCVDSVLNQTYRNLEIILVDDGSPDNCPQICDEYAQRDSRVMVVHKENEGVSIARNFAMSKMQGEYLMFVDSDDWIDLDTCEIAMKNILKNSCDVVMWSYVREFENKSLIKNIFDTDIYFDNNEACQKIYRRLFGLLGHELARPENADALCPIWGKFYKTEIIKKNNLQFFDIRKIGTYEDGLFNIEYFSKVNKANYINKPLYHYRKDNISSVTSLYKEKFFQQWMTLFEYMEKQIIDNNLDEDFSKALNNRICLSILGLGLNILSVKENVIWKIKNIKEILKNERYRKAYKTLELKYFPIHWKLFYACAKYNFAAGVFIFLVLIKKMIGKV